LNNAGNIQTSTGLEKTELKVEGMTCGNCVLTISKYLEKQGLQKVHVDIMDGGISFEGPHDISKDKIKKGIEGLGYKVASADATHKRRSFLKSPVQKFLFCLPFTVLLMLHMLPLQIHWLMDPWVQMILCLPVFIIGMEYFGTSAVKSIRNGIPNMNVLIALGAAAAFVYSLVGSLGLVENAGLYYESAAVIITLVFLGYWMEDVSVSSTQQALKELMKEQVVMANMIAFDDQHREQVFSVISTNLRSGDLVMIKTGEKVPADCKILWGNGSANESLLTGESMPVEKSPKDILIGGTVLEAGTIKAQVTAAGKDTVLARIIQLAKQAQAAKPAIQLLADRISAIFVPAVIAIAFLTLVANLFLFHVPFAGSLMRSIAVLVIACPCAMGLATPAAIAVGIGRAARHGVLFKNARSLELFKNIQQVVFDKTGTLTTGNFKISAWKTDTMDPEEFKKICFSLEKYSNHPVAKCIVNAWKSKAALSWHKVEEIKGYGIRAWDTAGNKYQAGSYKLATHPGTDTGHSIYVLKNEILLGWIDVNDEIREEARSVVDYFKQKKIKTFLLSGDNNAKCKLVAEACGIDEYYGEQSPEQKLEVVALLTVKAPTAMVGDGINDAPALAKATIGISLSDATHIAMQNSQIVLMNQGLKNLPLAIGLGKHTFITIKQNLFWAFFYNIIAIPIAAAGFLTPAIAAFAMGFSDVILAINSVRLRWKKVI
jgi:Cu+-exporting ATPase